MTFAPFGFKVANHFSNLEQSTFAKSLSGMESFSWIHLFLSGNLHAGCIQFSSPGGEEESVINASIAEKSSCCGSFRPSLDRKKEEESASLTQFPKVVLL